MVTTVYRALASLVVMALLLVGAPLSSGAATLPAQAPQQAAPTTGAALAERSSDDGPGSDSDRALLVERDSGAVAVAFPGWSADHRPPVRDLPDAYSSALPPVGSIAGLWARVPPPSSVETPDLDEVFALPFGRAPPLSERV